MKLRLLTAFAILAVCAVPALAADRDITLSSSATVAEWEGAADISRGIPVYDEDARTAIPCDAGPARPCEEVLIKVTEAGKFTATVEGLEGTGGTTDVDAYLYQSDASGAQGEKIASAAANGPDSVTAPKAAAGSFFLLVVDYYHSYNSGYKGKIKFTPAAPPAAPVTAAPTPAAPAPAAANSEPAAKKPSKRAACQKKAKKIKNKKKRAKAMKKCRRAKK